MAFFTHVFLPFGLQFQNFCVLLPSVSLFASVRRKAFSSAFPYSLCPCFFSPRSFLKFEKPFFY